MMSDEICFGAMQRRMHFNGGTAEKGNVPNVIFPRILREVDTVQAKGSIVGQIR